MWFIELSPLPETIGRSPRSQTLLLAQWLEAIHPGLNVVFMSGYTANVIAHHGVLEKGIHFITKPISRKELAVAVREALA